MLQIFEDLKEMKVKVLFFSFIFTFIYWLLLQPIIFEANYYFIDFLYLTIIIRWIIVAFLIFLGVYLYSTKIKKRAEVLSQKLIIKIILGVVLTIVYAFLGILLESYLRIGLYKGIDYNEMSMALTFSISLSFYFALNWKNRQLKFKEIRWGQVGINFIFLIVFIVILFLILRVIQHLFF